MEHGQFWISRVQLHSFVNIQGDICHKLQHVLRWTEGACQSHLCMKSAQESAIMQTTSEPLSNVTGSMEGTLQMAACGDPISIQHCP